MENGRSDVRKMEGVWRDVGGVRWEGSGRSEVVSGRSEVGSGRSEV